jgi:hypothetical protein
MHFRVVGRAAALVLLLFPAFQAAAQEETPAAACTAMVAPPAALSGWTAEAHVVSADKAAGLVSARLKLGQGSMVTLHPTRSVAYVTQPDKPGGSVASGGLLSVSITDAATYQVSLSSGAWIDVLQNGKPLISAAHAPGPACTGIRKTVQFALKPGQYVVQLSANADPLIQVMVSKVS